MPQAPARRDISQSSDVARLVRLHHRRRGWAWVAIGSVIGLAVYSGLDIGLLQHLAGTPAIIGAIPVLVLLALALAGLAVVIVDTSSLHRADAAAKASAKGRVTHYPVYAHVHRWPPRHPGSWVAAIFMLAAMTCITAYILPAEVNAWAYVVGAEQPDTFHPVSYGQTCGLSSRWGMRCSNTVTEGYLSSTGADVAWGVQVPLARPFSVRDPLWAWGSGRNLDAGDGSAIPTIVAGLFFDGIALLLLYIVVVILRETSPGRRRRMSVTPGAGPGGVRGPQHPDSGHRGSRGSRARRRAHGGPGRRRRKPVG